MATGLLRDRDTITFFAENGNDLWNGDGASDRLPSTDCCASATPHDAITGAVVDRLGGVRPRGVSRPVSSRGTPQKHCGPRALAPSRQVGRCARPLQIFATEDQVHSHHVVLGIVLDLRDRPSDQSSPSVSADHPFFWQELRSSGASAAPEPEVAKLTAGLADARCTPAPAFDQFRCAIRRRSGAWARTDTGNQYYGSGGGQETSGCLPL